MNDGVPTTDKLGQIRPIDGDENGSAIVDSGAYEFSVAVPETSDICSEITIPNITANSIDTTINGTEFDDEVLGTDVAEEFSPLGFRTFSEV